MFIFYVHNTLSKKIITDEYQILFRAVPTTTESFLLLTDDIHS
jgi:hypothetical protein